MSIEADDNKSGSHYDWNSLYEGHERAFTDPVLLEAEVIHGFKRGSKELGIPTANLSMDNLGDAGQSLQTGIYYGWARLNGEVYSTVVSVGWNPFYQNTTKTGISEISFCGTIVCINSEPFI
jgi:FAD synthase